jgi:hypothetical protein
MSANHARFHYSITCNTDDVAVLFCLRALCQLATQEAMPQIGWGGTGRAEWSENAGNFVLRFTNADAREVFVGEANRLLAGRWSVVSTSDNDPASPQR